MIFNTALTESTTKEDRRLLCKVMDIMLVVSDHMLDLIKARGEKYAATYQCHSICRAVNSHTPCLRVVDGHHLGVAHIGEVPDLKLDFRFTYHSWLKTPDGAIIDPYPV